VNETDHLKDENAIGD